MFASQNFPVDSKAVSRSVPSWYGKARNMVKLQLYIRGDEAGSTFNMDDPLLPVLLMRELQWQLVNRPPNTPLLTQRQMRTETTTGEGPSNNNPISDLSNIRMRPTGQNCSPFQHPSEIVSRPTNYNANVENKKRRRRQAKSKSNQPKRPLSSFMLFLKENRQKIVDFLPPGANLMSINKEAANRWHSLPEVEAQKYRIAAKENMNGWHSESNHWKSSYAISNRNVDLIKLCNGCSNEAYMKCQSPEINSLECSVRRSSPQEECANKIVEDQKIEFNVDLNFEEASKIKRNSEIATTEEQMNKFLIEGIFNQENMACEDNMNHLQEVAKLTENINLHPYQDSPTKKLKRDICMEPALINEDIFSDAKVICLNI